MVLADFGVARALDSASAFTIAAGTPHYMAPEQSEGRADERSDVYAAGVLLYELLAGRVPYPYPSVGAVMRAQLTERPAPISSLRDETPASLDAVIGRGCHRSPISATRPRVNGPKALRSVHGSETPPDPSDTGSAETIIRPATGRAAVEGAVSRLRQPHLLAVPHLRAVPRHHRCRRRSRRRLRPHHLHRAADQSVAATASSPPRSWSC